VTHETAGAMTNISRTDMEITNIAYQLTTINSQPVTYTKHHHI